MKKQLFILTLLLALVFALTLPASGGLGAGKNSAGENGAVGSAAEEEYSTVSASKTAHYYTRSGKPQFSFTLYATFGYDGKSAWPKAL